MINWINQLIEIHRTQESWQGHDLTEFQLLDYFQTLNQKGRLLLSGENHCILGYVESWRITFEQFGRIICQLPFAIGEENIEQGPIAYVANIFVQPQARKSWVIKDLTKQFFTQNIDADFFVGEAHRKKTGLVKVFSWQEAYQKWAREPEGVRYG